MLSSTLLSLGTFFQRFSVHFLEDLDLHAGSQAIRGDISVYETLSVSTIVPLSRSSSVGVYVYSSSDPSFTIGVSSGGCRAPTISKRLPVLFLSSRVLLPFSLLVLRY